MYQQVCTLDAAGKACGNVIDGTTFRGKFTTKRYVYMGIFSNCKVLIYTEDQSECRKNSLRVIGCFSGEIRMKNNATDLVSDDIEPAELPTPIQLHHGTLAERCYFDYRKCLYSGYVKHCEYFWDDEYQPIAQKISRELISKKIKLEQKATISSRVKWHKCAVSFRRAVEKGTSVN